MYKKNKIGQIIRISDGAFIPNDERNNDYKEYLNWLSAGNIPIDEVAIERQKEEELFAQKALEASLAAEKAAFEALPEQEKAIADIIPVIKDNRTEDEILLDNIRLARFKEYPTILECIEALMENMEGRPEKLLMVQSKREFVRNKYPKPLSMQLGGK